MPSFLQINSMDIIRVSPRPDWNARRLSGEFVAGDASLVDSPEQVRILGFEREAGSGMETTPALHLFFFFEGSKTLGSEKERGPEVLERGAG